MVQDTKKIWMPQDNDRARQVAKAARKHAHKIVCGLNPFRDKYYIVVGEKGSLCSSDNTDGKIIARGHPLFTLFTVKQVINPAYYEVTPTSDVVYGTSRNSYARKVLCRCDEYETIKQCRSHDPEWDKYLIALIAEWHSSWEVRRLAIMTLQKAPDRNLLERISGARGDMMHNLRWLAQQFLIWQDPYKVPMLRLSHLKVILR